MILAHAERGGAGLQNAHLVGDGEAAVDSPRSQEDGRGVADVAADDALDGTPRHGEPPGHLFLLINALANGCFNFEWKRQNATEAERYGVLDLALDGPLFAHANCVPKRTIFDHHPTTDRDGRARTRLDWSDL